MAIDQSWFVQRLQTAGLSQRQLSKMFSNSPGTMSNVLLGNRNLRLDELPIVASALGVSIEELLRRLGIAGPARTADPSNTVPVLGTVNETATVEDTRTTRRVPRPADTGRNLSAIVMESQTGDGPHQGWTYYIDTPTKDRAVDATSLNALCVVQIGDSEARHLGIVQRSVEPGRFNLVNPFNGSAIVNGVQIRNALPVAWIKTQA